MISESSRKFTPPQEKPEHKRTAGKKIFEFLSRTGFLELRKSNDQFEQWLQNLSYEDYSNFLTRLNGILRESTIKDRSVDGKDVKVTFGIMNDTAYLPPAAEQKNNLMKDSFEALKTIPGNEDRALLTYYILQAIHPYSDGNGRTGRLLHEIISKNGKELNQEHLSELLDHDTDGHRETGQGRSLFAKTVLDANSAYYYINREVVKEVLGPDFLNENGSIYVAAIAGVGNLSEDTKQHLSREEIVLAEQIIGEGDVHNFSFRGIVLSKLLREKKELQRYQYEVKQPLDERRGVVPEDVGKKITGIDAEELIPHLTENDARRLIEIHTEVKSTFIKNMIDIFVHPEKYQMQNSNGNSVAIKDVFRIS